MFLGKKPQRLHDIVLEGDINKISSFLEEFDYDEEKIDIRDENDDTVLDLAIKTTIEYKDDEAKFKHGLKIINLLTGYLNEDATNTYGDTTLHSTIRLINESPKNLNPIVIIIEILSNLFDLNARNNNNETPLHLAEDDKTGTIKETLLKIGATPLEANDTPDYSDSWDMMDHALMPKNDEDSFLGKFNKNLKGDLDWESAFGNTDEPPDLEDDFFNLDDTDDDLDLDLDDDLGFHDDALDLGDDLDLDTSMNGNIRDDDFDDLSSNSLSPEREQRLTKIFNRFTNTLNVEFDLKNNLDIQEAIENLKKKVRRNSL